MSQGSAFQVDLPYNLIQSLRFIHALLESDFDVRIPTRHHQKLVQLREVFDISLNGKIEGVPVLPGLRIYHQGMPTTRLGSIQRPLIFAHGMVNHCRSLWSGERTRKVVFAGRFHRERRNVVQKWLREQLPHLRAQVPDQSVVDRRVRLRKRVQDWSNRLLRGPLRSLQSWVRVPPVERRVEYDGVVLMTSDRGWSFPTKAWDSKYFQLLSSSKFVLCPDGKFVWTYRFFEAILCGAIPIIQNTCSLYEGFRYYTMDDLLEKMEWRVEDAHHNAALCRERLTVPSDALHGEIQRLLRADQS